MRTGRLSFTGKHLGPSGLRRENHLVKKENGGKERRRDLAGYLLDCIVKDWMKMELKQTGRERKVRVASTESGAWSTTWESCRRVGSKLPKGDGQTKKKKR